MRALVLTRHGPPEVLRVEQRDEPRSGAGEVRIRVHAAGVNFADIQARVGMYPEAPKPPCVLGYEVAGTIDEVGAGVDRALQGQRVMAATRFGGFAEHAVTHASNIIPLPDAMTFVQGAAVPVVYGTAYSAVVSLGNVQAGERVLVHAAAGGVGIAAVQLLRLRGAEIFGSASAQKHDALREEGVSHPIDYRTGDVAEKVRAITGGVGLDVILDPRGGAGLKQSYGLLRPGGRLVMYGVNDIVKGETRNLLQAAKLWWGTPRFDGLDMLTSSKSVLAVNMLKIGDDRGHFGHVTSALEQLMRDGTVKPRVGATFPLEDAAAAHRLIQDRKNVGKVVLVVRDE